MCACDTSEYSNDTRPQEPDNVNGMVECQTTQQKLNKLHSILKKVSAKERFPLSGGKPVG